MPALVVSSAFRVGLIWSFSGVEYAANVFHYVVPGVAVSSQGAVDDLAADVLAAHTGSNLDDQQADEVSLARVTLRDLRVANQPEYSASVSGPGLSTTDPLPLGVSGVVTLRTALAGRRYRGRMYLPGWAEVANGGTGRMSTAAVTAAEAFVLDLTGVSVQGNTWNMGVLSVANLDIEQVTSVACRDNIWDSQRRRAVAGV